MKYFYDLFFLVLLCLITVPCSVALSSPSQFAVYSDYYQDVKLLERAMTTRDGAEADGGAPVMNIEAEGPLLLSTTEVNRTFVFQELIETVEHLLEVEAIR